MAIWHALMMDLPAGEPFGKAGSFCKRFLRALILLFTSVCKMCIKDRLETPGLSSPISGTVWNVSRTFAHFVKI